MHIGQWSRTGWVIEVACDCLHASRVEVCFGDRVGELVCSFVYSYVDMSKDSLRFAGDEGMRR